MGFVIASSVVLIGFALVAVKFSRHFTSPHCLPATSEWVDELSIDRYQPMLRLLDEGDFAFLRTQPGFTPEKAAKVRIDRCRLFQKYLYSLEEDFKRICMALKVLTVQSKHDRPDLASLLLWNQITFAYGMTMAEFRLVCYRYGLGTVDVSGLVKLFDGIRLQLRTMVPAEY